MNLDVAICAARILRILIMRWASRLVGSDAVVHAVARQTELVHTTEFQESWIRRTVRRVTGNASVRLERRVLVSEWALLIGMAFYAGCICARRQSCLFELEAAVRIVTIATFHRAFEDLVMKWFVEVGLNFVVTTDAELRLAGF